VNEQINPGRIDAAGAGGSYPVRIDERQPRHPVALSVLSSGSALLLYAALLACVLAVTHLFFHFIGRAPIIAVDDALGNVAVNLSAHGRYGFPASPIQGFSGALRLDDFMNYGPWPVAIGALLDWLFGTSYAIQRSVHLLGLLVTNLAVFLLLRRVSLAAVGMYLLISVTLFWQAEWPMVRPDFAVAMFGGLAIAAATLALRYDSRKAWFACGFCAASAVTTHPIAFSLVPWAALIWLAAPLVVRPGSAVDAIEPVIHPARRFIWLVAGGVLAGLVFLAAAKFQVRELITLWTAGADFLSTATREPFYVTMMRHAKVAWPLPASTFYPVIICFIGSVGFAALALFSRFPKRRAVLALLLPPVSLSIVYQVSLGAYGNFHSGYGLLSHTATAWAIAAAVAASTLVMASFARSLGALWEVGGRVIAVALLSMLTAILVLRPDHWSAAARIQVNIDDYLQQVISLLPPHASVWGTVDFGLESGKRIDLLQFGDGVAFTADFKPQEREAISPDFLVFDNTLMRDMSFGIVRARSNPPTAQYRSPLDPVVELFPHLQYRLLAMVNAAPYGTARVYGRFREGEGPERPLVAVNDGASPQWAKLVGAPIAVTPESTEPATFRLTFISTHEAKADRTRVVRLPAGTYLVKASVSGRSPDHVGLLVATPTSQFVGAAGDIGFTMAQAPYFPYDQSVSMIVNHPGGALYFSQFDANMGANFTITEVRPIEYMRAAQQAIAVPALSKWVLAGGSGRVTMLPDGRADVVGNDQPLSYQFASPPIPVPPGATLQFSSELQLSSGKVALGVLDEHGAWLVFPQLLRTNFSIESGPNKAITVVVAGIGGEPLKQPVEFTISQPKLFLARPADDYQHRLAACREKARPVPSSCLVAR
jgi:hypothetical protein